jgi:WD40 repeat protein
MLAAGDHKNRVWLKNLQTGKVVKFKGKKHISKIKSVEFSPDNKTLAAVGIDKIARVWDVVTGKEVVTLEGNGKSGIWTKPQVVTSLAFAPDGKTVATGSSQGKVTLWNSKTWHEIMTIKAHKSIVSSIAFSPDGNLLATNGLLDSNVKIWSLSTGKELATVSIQEYLNDYISVTFSPDGSMLAIASERHVELWEIVRGKPKVEPESLNPLGNLLAVFILPYFDMSMPVETIVSFSPDGRLIAASNGGAAIWDISTSQRLWRLVPYGHPVHRVWKDAVYDLAFSPDGKTFAAAFCDSLCLFDVP